MSDPLVAAPGAGVLLPSGGVPLELPDPVAGPQPPVVRLPAAPERAYLIGGIRLGDGSRLPVRGLAIVALVALVPTVAAIGVALLLSLGTGQPTTGEERGENVSSSGGADEADDADGGSKGAAAVGAGVSETALDDAGDALQDAGVRRLGSVQGAWTWRDGDQTLLVAVTRRVTRRNSDLSARAVTLRAVLVADPTGRAKVLGTIEDDGQVCARDVEMKADVRPADVTVKDIDGDGTREALVAWAHRCGPDDVQRRAGVLAATGVYQLAGAGALVAEPDPPSADWPDGFLDLAATALDRT